MAAHVRVVAGTHYIILMEEGRHDRSYEPGELGNAFLLLEDMLNGFRAEGKIREEFPAIQKAYEEYQLLIKMYKE